MQYHHTPGVCFKKATSLLLTAERCGLAHTYWLVVLRSQHFPHDIGASEELDL